VLIAGVAGRVVLNEELEAFVVASRNTDEGMRVVFAGAQAVSGPGELLRIYPEAVRPDGVLDVQLAAAVFNDGRIAGRADGSVAGIAQPTSFVLHANHPNPFNPETTIRYEVSEAGRVNLRVYDVAGQVVRELVREFQTPGSYAVVWNGRDKGGVQVANGLYLYELRAGGYRAVRKMILLK